MVKDYYYNIEKDIELYPGAWAYIVIGGRNCGKTYSCLKSCHLNKREFIFLKRTNDDVDLLCSGTGRIGQKTAEFGIDLSPFKSVNRDCFTDIRAHSIKSGLGGFWYHDEGEPTGTPIGYLLSLNAVSKYKGFDLSNADWVIFDEFQPQPWDRVNRKEGEQLLDLYKTVSRDREHRGRSALKLICLANATSISNPVTNILEITDIIADMQVQELEYIYLEDRGIVIHLVKNNADFDEVEHGSQIYKAMGETAWGRMAFNNEFGYNDLSNISKVNLKGYRPVCAILYKRHRWYVYQRDGWYYMCSSRHNGRVYDLNKENDQKLFFYDYDIDLRESCINGYMKFEKYTMYDIIVNYKSFFKL